MKKETSAELPRRTSKREPRGLPPPTPSEAAFEALLARFEAGPQGQPERLEESRCPEETDLEPAPPDDPDTFLAELFARRDEFLRREPFARIGDAEQFNTKVVGVSFRGRQAIASGLVAGAALELVREPANEKDANAIAVRFGALQVGYIRRQIAEHIAPSIDAGERYSATVIDVTGGGPERHFGVNVHVRRHRSAALRRRPDGRSAALDLLDGDAPEERVRRALIGTHAVREAQRAVLERVAAGHNTLAVLGTGRGKSFCFQLPAAERALREGAKTLVFYPLRALANDQHAALGRRLGPLGVRVFRANGSLDADERGALDVALEDGTWDVMLATPEFAAYHREAFARPCNRPALLVVDEAHHVFESRHRPAYTGFAEAIEALGRPQVLALTATAGSAAFAEIRAQLGIEHWVIDPTVRDNLHVVDARERDDKETYLERELCGDGRAIVYCTSRNEATKVAVRLRRSFGECVAFYHAGMPSDDRAVVEDLFRAGTLRVVVATSAFGEGIDLPDVRDVVLYHLNFALTEFNQQAGRAGRDGLPARIHLLYGQKDRRINDFIIARAAPSLETLRDLYRAMRELASDDVVRMTYEDVARTLERNLIDATTVSAALNIWEEAGLVERGRDDDGRFVRFLDVREKVDLTATTRFAEGAAERESFDRFCALALDADAPALETLLNRPIYPERVPLTR